MSLTAALEADLRKSSSGGAVIAREVERHARLLEEGRATFFESPSIDADRSQPLAAALRAAVAGASGSSLEVLRDAMRSAAHVLRMPGAVIGLIDAKVKTAVLRSTLAVAEPRVVVVLRHRAAVYRELRRKHFLAYGYGHWGSVPRPLLPSIIRHLHEYDGHALCAPAAASSVLCVSYDDVIDKPGRTAARIAEWLGLATEWPRRGVPTRFGEPALLDLTRTSVRPHGFSIERHLINRTSAQLSPVEEDALAKLSGASVQRTSWSLLPGELWAIARAPWRAFAILSTGRANRRGSFSSAEGDQE